MQANDYIVLLHKQLTGEINASEQALLSEWISQSPENEQFANDLHIAWEKSGGYEKIFQPDLQLAYGQLQARIRATERPPMRVLTFSQKLFRVAAAAAVLIVGVWSFQYFSGATSAPAVIVAVTESAVREIVLPDGSKIWLRPGAELRYPAQFTGAERRVQLRGEAYFEVTHNPAQAFKVEIGDGKSTVEVLGTSFNIRESQIETAVTVKTGTVRFQPESGHAGVVLQTGDKAVLNRSERKLNTEKVLTFNELSWQTGGLEFIRTPLNQVIADMQAYYGVQITLLNTSLQNCKHTAPLTNQPLEKVLESLSLTYQLRVEKTGLKEYRLLGGNCR